LLLRYVEALGGGDVAETGRASREALALARTLGDRRGEAGALFGRAVSAMLAGDFADADADADSAAHLARAVDDVRVLARSLTLRGNTAMRRGDLDAALAHYTAALATTDDSVTVAKIASNAANVYERLGRLPEALVLYRRALGIVRAARDTASEALVLGNVGAVFTRLARDPGASGTRAESPVRAASAAARAPDRTAADSALGYAQRELALARALRDPSRIARAEDHVGAALAAAGRPAEALAPLARASAGYTRLGQRAERLANLRVAAEANLALGQRAAAAAVARTAVALADSLDAHEERAEALGVLALASAANGEPAAALAAAWAGRAALDAVYATSRAAAAERTRAAFEVARRQWALDQAEARGVALRAEVARQRTLVWLGALGAALATALLVSSCAPPASPGRTPCWWPRRASRPSASASRASSTTRCSKASRASRCKCRSQSSSSARPTPAARRSRRRASRRQPSSECWGGRTPCSRRRDRRCGTSARRARPSPSRPPWRPCWTISPRSRHPRPALRRCPSGAWRWWDRRRPSARHGSASSCASRARPSPTPCATRGRGR
jgi:tetratricopeptide (TPR) repeat protein